MYTLIALYLASNQMMTNNCNPTYSVNSCYSNGDDSNIRVIKITSIDGCKYGYIDNAKTPNDVYFNSFEAIENVYPKKINCKEFK